MSRKGGFNFKIFTPPPGDYFRYIYSLTGALSQSIPQKLCSYYSHTAITTLLLIHLQENNDNLYVLNSQEYA
jgi:hypothetical protein